MGKILRINQLDSLHALSESKKKIVLAGGFFDVLHPGHVIFLEEAKKAGDVLVVLLESDRKARQLKGPKRPVHDQKMRARVLSALRDVDYVVKLPFIESDRKYDEIIGQIKPHIIALTRGYGPDEYHKRTAKIIGAKIKYVTKMVGDHSTSRILGGKS